MPLAISATPLTTSSNRSALDRAGVGVVEDDVGALAAEFQRELLQVPGRGLHDQLADLSGTGEGDLVHVIVTCARLRLLGNSLGGAGIQDLALAG
jgi:hypothetical protein